MFSFMSMEKEIYDIEYEKAFQKKQSISQYTEDWIDTTLNKLIVGDLVYVEYSADSQKYIYTYHPECGIVREIKKNTYQSVSDNTTKTEYSVIIQNHNGDLIDLNKDHLSIYSSGYVMFIKKYELLHRRTPPPYMAYGDRKCFVCGDDHEKDFIN